jgi:hypothetical protein
MGGNTVRRLAVRRYHCRVIRGVCVMIECFKSLFTGGSFSAAMEAGNPANLRESVNVTPPALDVSALGVHIERRLAPSQAASALAKHGHAKRREPIRAKARAMRDALGLDILEGLK